MKPASVFILSIFFLSSCEGEKVGEGYVYDQETKLPIDSVKYYRISGSHVYYTDTIGKYYITGPFGSCVSDCPDYDAEFSKPGYKTKTISNPDGDIYLETE